MILVPVKNLENAKQRLASVLDQGTRTELAQAMLHDVLDALAACCSNSEVSLVTSDPFALNLAQTLVSKSYPMPQIAAKRMRSRWQLSSANHEAWGAHS